MPQMRFKQEKMRELALYLAHQHRDDIAFGRVRLAKELYYADMEAYVRLGDSITGASYVKLPQGPGAREFVPLRDEMLAFGEAVESNVNYPNGMVGKRLLAQRDPDLSVLDSEEIKIADAIAARFEGYSGSQISKKSHDEIGWRVAEMNGVIPYQHYYLAPDVTEAQMDKAVEIAQRLNLASAA